METYSLLTLTIAVVIAFYLGRENGISKGITIGKESSGIWVTHFKDKMQVAERLNREKLVKIHELQDRIEQLEEENQLYASQDLDK